MPKMSEYVNIPSTLPFFILFINLVFCQLPSNQITTMTKLYEMLQNNSGSSILWSEMKKDSNPCSWMGVSCSSSNSSVTKLSLSLFSISTPEILPVVCEIDSLESLDLSNNHFSSIPDVFISACGRISGLKLLNFSRNQLGGFLPTFNGFQMLEALDLSHNFLMAGNITLQLNGLDSLKSLNLSYNKFNGPLPINLGKNDLLQELQLSTNAFQGEIPVEVVKYGNLCLIDFSHNYLYGSIPERLGDLSKLQILVLSANNLSGGIPKSLVSIKTLFQFAAKQNNFVGNIPAGITMYLRNLDLSFNHLSGTIPQDFLSPPNLLSVDLSSNLLEGPIPTDISFSLFMLRLGGNSLNGTISFRSYGNLTKLTYLELDNNNLTGVIPPELGSCRSLALLNLAHNGLTGDLPPQLGNLSNLQGLHLQRNKLVGVIPDQFTQLHSLQRMNFSSNSIRGSIPASISKLQYLTNLDLRDNNLNGSLPISIGSLNSLSELQLGNNQLSGHVPEMPSSLQIALNLSSNFFNGPIPKTVSRLTSLDVLDLSNNQFSGSIPEFLTEMISLRKLVLSNNQFSGYIPTNGIEGLFSTSSAGIKHSKGLSTGMVIAVAFFSGFIFGFMIVKIIPFVNYSRDRTKFEWIINDAIQKSSFDFSRAMKEVHRQANILLKSEFYTCYKVSMPCGMNYSIKNLYWTCKTFSLVSPKTFSQEVKLLDQLRESNIMFPLAYALTSQSALLIYECPQHGTLFDLVHRSDENALTWDIRYNIAVSVSKGLAYLHGFYGSTSAPIVLLHLSSRSIFMRSLSEPLIGDIELAKVIDPSKSLGTLSVVAGAVGYVPPEYAYTMRITISGNIYSFGTILLELLTGKQAVHEGIELVKWVTDKVEHCQLEEILDPGVRKTSGEVLQQMISMFKISMLCVSISPLERPDAKELHTMLLDVAPQFIM